MNNAASIKRNLIFYCGGVLLISAWGGWLTAGGNQVGGLVLIMCPMVLAIALRATGGDGWADAGLALRWKESWQWYLLALLAFPVSIALIVVFGMLIGFTTVNATAGDFFTVLLRGMVAQVSIRMIFAMFEEWGWRGYMEPRLESLGIADRQRHLMVGTVWGIWHFPLIFSTDYTKVSYVIFLPAFMVGVLIQAIVYGQIRKASRSVWPAVLLHGVGNTIAWALVQGNLLTINNKMVAFYAPESLFSMILWAGLGAYLLSQRRSPQ